MSQTHPASVAVIGLGYVGLPLAVALARSVPTIGLDINRQRIEELTAGHDRTGEIDADTMADSALRLTADAEECRGADFYIVTVPTPIDSANAPDLGAIRSATRAVGKLLEAGKPAVVVYESTVYPGVTEDICGPLLEEESSLVCGRDFFLGYSPERINPGDREHTVDRIVKVVAGQTPEVTEQLARLYGMVTQAGVFRAASIRSAEAAKVIENAQRDINIAFMNEIAQIFDKLDLSVWDVLEAARTKWNFLPFQPGLVGGHCIGVDPYYLSYRAQEAGHRPDVILAGRSINDGMGSWVADRLHEKRGGVAGSVLVMGLTFKEDVPDLRNSRVVDVIGRLQELGHQVVVHDPMADAAEAHEEFGIDLLSGSIAGQHDIVFLAVPHRSYVSLDPDAIRRLIAPQGMLADLKGAWRDSTLAREVAYWSL